MRSALNHCTQGAVLLDFLVFLGWLLCFKLPPGEPAALASREPWVRVSARGNLKTNPRFNFENQIRAQRGFLSNLKSKTIFWEGNKIDGISSSRHAATLRHGGISSNDFKATWSWLRTVIRTHWKEFNPLPFLKKMIGIRLRFFDYCPVNKHIDFKSKCLSSQMP